MKIAVIIVRFFIGFMFLFSCANFVFQFMSQPEVEGNAKLFIVGMAASGYIFPFVKIVEALGALSLISNRFVPLATIVIFPVTLNIFLYHAFLDPGNMVIPVLLLGGNLLLAFYHRSKYQSMLTVSAK